MEDFDDIPGPDLPEPEPPAAEFQLIPQENRQPAVIVPEGAFAPLRIRAETAIANCMALRVTDAGQKDLIKKARESRLAIRAVRLEAEHTKDRLKEDIIDRGRNIDRLFAGIVAIADPVEKHLQAQEDFAANQEKARIRAETERRAAALRVISADPSLYNLAVMTVPEWQTLLEQLTFARQRKIEADAKLERERKEREYLEKIERERLRVENECLRKKAETDREERAKVDAAAEAEKKKLREANEKAERELAAQRQAKAKRIADEEARALREAQAPDREKLYAFADKVRSLIPPTMDTVAAKTDRAQITQQLERFASWIEGLAGKL